MDNLLDVEFVIVRESVITANLFCLKTLQDVSVVRPSPCALSGIVQIRTGRLDEGGLALVEKRVEVRRDGLALLRRVERFENLGGSEKIQFKGLGTRRFG